jgi:hypothetical protein
MRPKPSLAAKSGVGELAARESEAPNASKRERERGELQPPIWPAGLRFCGPYCFFGIGGEASRCQIPQFRLNYEEAKGQS